MRLKPISVNIFVWQNMVGLHACDSKYFRFFFMFFFIFMVCFYFSFDISLFIYIFNEF